MRTSTCAMCQKECRPQLCGCCLDEYCRSCLDSHQCSPAAPCQARRVSGGFVTVIDEPSLTVETSPFSDRCD